jgi:hypothetical protein
VACADITLVPVSEAVSVITTYRREPSRIVV